jgi:hypothetical protein
MFNNLRSNLFPTLGGFSNKLAGAYLLPPTEKIKKKKKVTPVEETELDKEAAFAEQAILEQQAITRRQLQSGDFGGGWNPFNQF